MNKRGRKYQSIKEAKESLKRLPLYELKSRFNSGILTKIGSIAIRELIKEKEEQMSPDKETNDAFYNGEKIGEVAFIINDSVEILEGEEKGRFGSVISLISLSPEPIYLIELDGSDGDRKFPQSLLRLVD